MMTPDVTHVLSSPGNSRWYTDMVNFGKNRKEEFTYCQGNFLEHKPQIPQQSPGQVLHCYTNRVQHVEIPRDNLCGGHNRLVVWDNAQLKPSCCKGRWELKELHLSCGCIKQGRVTSHNPKIGGNPTSSSSCASLKFYEIPFSKVNHDSFGRLYILTHFWFDVFLFWHLQDQAEKTRIPRWKPHQKLGGKRARGFSPTHQRSTQHVSAGLNSACVPGKIDGIFSLSAFADGLPTITTNYQVTIEEL